MDRLFNSKYDFIAVLAILTQLVLLRNSSFDFRYYAGCLWSLGGDDRASDGEFDAEADRKQAAFCESTFIAWSIMLKGMRPQAVHAVTSHSRNSSERTMIYSLLKGLIYPSVQKYRRLRARSEISKFISHSDPRVRAVGTALLETLTGVLSSEEQAWVQRIEQRRNSLMHSDKSITVIAYGAGRPGSKKTMEEMNAGHETTGMVRNICKASKPPFWATLLFKMVRSLKPKSCIELGSCVGISASYLSAACKMNGKGVLRTLEGSPATAEIARETLEGLGLENASVITGPFHKTLQGVLELEKPVDFFFNDGHHDRAAVLQYFSQSLPCLSQDAVIVFDDISWSSGMRQAWEEIENDPRVLVTIDLHDIGIAVLGHNPAAKEKYRLPL